ncbi:MULTISPECIES: hypothetical protein [unclassified Mycobacterium]|uniref:hypothetical protein n=1 Tax=unclassified Mycobacterium TaxID=2642494 RepID=UPI0029C89D55|nr:MULTISPECIES: hypothetical protein [unclassified Mycobacterium]
MSVVVVGPGSISRDKPASHWWSVLVRYFTADAVSDSGGRRYPRSYPPKNYTYLETAAMRRAMERL